LCYSKFDDAIAGCQQWGLLPIVYLGAVVAVNVERYFKKLLIISAKLAMATRKKLMISSLFTSR
jgi:hypothetical protein